MIAILLIFLGLFIFSFSSKSNDTLELKAREEITVEGRKEPIYKVWSLSQKQLEVNNWALSNSAQAVSTFPGVYVRDYGGIGGLKTISLRGFSPSDVAVLLDGIKINSPQNGLVDLSLIPVDAFEEIELTRGGASFIHGNNTASGYLNFISPKNINKSAILFSYGSFEQLKLNIMLPLQWLNFHKSHFIVDYFSSNGRYPIDVQQFETKATVNRENNRVNRISVFATNHIELSSLLASAIITYTNSVRGVPGAVVQNRIENKESKLYDELLLLNLKLIPTFLSPNFQILFGSIRLKNKFFDPQMNILLIGKSTAEYLNTETTLKLIYEPKTPLVKLGTFAEANLSSVKGDMLENPNETKIKRKGLAFCTLIGRNLNLRNIVLGFEASLRADLVTYITPRFSHYLGFFIKDTILNLVTKINYTDNFRLPSFNEMYFMNYGNRDLLPEKTSGINLELAYNLSDLFQGSFSVFYYTTKDKIVAIPKSPVQWSAKNISKSSSKGIEFSISTKNKLFNSLFSMSILSTMDETKDSPTYGKQLIYTPNIITNCLINVPIPKNFSLTFRSNFVGRRYSLADNSKNSELKEYFLFDIVTSKTIILNKYTIVLNFEICNIFDKKYEIILNYPMPGRNIVCTIKSIF